MLEPESPKLNHLYFPMSLDSNNLEKPAIVESSLEKGDATPVTAVNLGQNNSLQEQDHSVGKSTNFSKKIQQHICIEDEAAIKSANEFAEQIIKSACNGDQAAVQNLTDKMMKRLNIDEKVAKSHKGAKETVIHINMEPKAKRQQKPQAKQSKKA